MKQSELFPETLLVSRDGDGRIYTDSLRVAAYFHKAHRNVVRSIERLLEELPVDAFDVLNFERVEYKDKKGETRFMFHLNRDAFAVLTMGFTGKQALRWKPIVEHQDYRRAALIELTGHKSPGSITACRRRMREVGLLDGRSI
jgi:Rha family phage regulatory protein